MTPKLSIRVTLAPDGRTPVREIVFEGRKIGEISYIELIEFVAQSVGTLRWEQNRDG